MSDGFFIYDFNTIAALETSLSPARLASYIRRTAGDKERALRLYLWNTALSEALYGPLQGLEIALRNALNRELCAHYGPQWYENKKPVLFPDTQAEKIQKAISEFDKGRLITVSDVVASLTLGFWADILHYEMYDQMWRECTHKAFPNRPKGTRRGNIAPTIKRLKNLRNRVAHHEPIFHLPRVRPILHVVAERAAI